MSLDKNIAINKRKEIYQSYYTEEDYEKVMIKLPDIIKEASIKSAEMLEPTIIEKKEVMNIIRDFIRKKHRKIYGGTAVNELLKQKNPEDAIYDEFNFSDIEFYSPTPVPDLVELCNTLYDKGYKYVQGREAQHEETYTISVNFEVYCDISYVPTRVYNGIKVIDIDGINYVDPHFMWIDYLRMFNNPVTANWRWEKSFKRNFILLKNYPPEYYNKNIQISEMNQEFKGYIQRIKKEFIIEKSNNNILINGFDAYNFFMLHAANDKKVDQMARTVYGKNNVMNLTCNIPYLDLVSVDYSNTVKNLYNYLKGIVKVPEKLEISEYFPLFQFTNYSSMISYNGIIITKITEGNGFCIPMIRVNSGLIYVSYQYLLMTFLIDKFRAHLDQDKTMYFNYSIAISNLIKARNIFLDTKKLTVVDNSVFREFKISCIGTTTSQLRLSKLRMLERKQKDKNIQFTYTPEQFFKQSEESQHKFDPFKHFFRNTSGNKITNMKNMRFKLDNQGELIDNINEIDYTTENDSESKTTENDSESKTTENDSESKTTEIEMDSNSQ